jgi:hypothetical protein
MDEGGSPNLFFCCNLISRFEKALKSTQNKLDKILEAPFYRDVFLLGFKDKTIKNKPLIN